MRRGRQIVGLPVIATAQAAKVGVVEDLAIDPAARAVTALLLGNAAEQAPARLVPFERVRRVGPDAVMIEDESAVKPASGFPQFRTLCQGPARITGLQVITEDGRTVGTIADVGVDDRSGLIVQFHVSAGPLRDVVAGRILVPAEEVRAVGVEYVIVPEVAVSGRRAQLEQGPPLVLETPPAQFVELPPEEMERLAAGLVVRQEDLIVGMRAGKTIANEDAGGVICFEGEPISQEIVRRAKAAGKLNLLVEAAGEAAIAAFSRGLAEQYARVAVGRMAGRTVRTTVGDVVVSQGDVVTSEVVDRAREAGVLDQLMEAVRATSEEGHDPWSRRREVARSLWESMGERLRGITGRS